VSYVTQKFGNRKLNRRKMQIKLLILAFLGENWWIITKINFSTQKQAGVAMPERENLEVFMKLYVLDH
jgi:hypothetical protein